MQVAMARVMPCDHTAWLSVHQACVVPKRLPQGFGMSGQLLLSVPTAPQREPQTLEPHTGLSSQDERSVPSCMTTGCLPAPVPGLR